MANNDDFYRDIENLFDQRDKPKEKPINWDDYNFNFDDEIPSAGAQAPQRGRNSRLNRAGASRRPFCDQKAQRGESAGQGGTKK